jgi:hypothetical protein
VRIKHLQLVTQKHSVTVTKTLTAYSPFGPVKAGLTTSQTTQEARLSELLSSLESVVESLVSKSSTVLDTLTTATEGVRVALSATATDEAGTNV